MQSFSAAMIDHKYHTVCSWLAAEILNREVLRLWTAECTGVSQAFSEKRGQDYSLFFYDALLPCLLFIEVGHVRGKKGSTKRSTDTDTLRKNFLLWETRTIETAFIKEYPNVLKEHEIKKCDVVLLLLTETMTKDINQQPLIPMTKTR